MNKASMAWVFHIFDSDLETIIHAFLSSRLAIFCSQNVDKNPWSHITVLSVLHWPSVKCRIHFKISVLLTFRALQALYWLVDPVQACPLPSLWRQTFSEATEYKTWGEQLNQLVATNRPVMITKMYDIRCLKILQWTIISNKYTHFKKKCLLAFYNKRRKKSHIKGKNHTNLSSLIEARIVWRT